MRVINWQVERDLQDDCNHATAFAQICRDVGDPCEWPEDMQELLLSSRTLLYSERLRVATFLIGNGVRECDAQRVLLAHARDDSAARHVRACIADAIGNKYPYWTYFDVRVGTKRRLDGAVKDTASANGAMHNSEGERFQRALLGYGAALV